MVQGKSTLLQLLAYYKQIVANLLIMGDCKFVIAQLGFIP